MPQHTLVTTAWLAEHLHDPDLRIVDIRGRVLPASAPMPHYFNHREDYEKSHIPGAVFIDWTQEITDPADPRHSQIAKPERYTALMQRIGINADTLVIAYDDADGMFAARVYWSLHYYGHERVAVLDGGWQQWLAEERPVTADVPTFAPGNFMARPDATLIRTGEQVLAKLHDPAVALVDVRTPGEFKGEFARAPRKGHIPGATNLPRQDLLTPEGRLRPVDEVKTLAQQAGVDDSKDEIICYCNGGVSASYGYLAMKIAGYANVAVYDGSWKEWGHDDSKPIE